ncbi:MAG: hypothetical protein WC113_04255 [Candidatus Paceibacterota bacterium]
MKNAKIIVIGIVILFVIGFIYSQYRSQNPVVKPAGERSTNEHASA